eukprot:1138090-Pelagomonas_calceolata.AAC.2
MPSVTSRAMPFAVHCYTTLKVQAFIFESAAQGEQDVPESTVHKCKCGPPVLLILPRTSVLC